MAHATVNMLAPVIPGMPRSAYLAVLGSLFALMCLPIVGAITWTRL